MRALLVIGWIAVAAAAGAPGGPGGPGGPEALTLTAADGGTVSADLYDGGGAGVVLVHGAAFDKGSWAALASTLRDRGVRVVAVDLRGEGASKAGTRGDAGRPDDVLAAVRELHRRGAPRVAVLGASMGGAVAAEAVAAARPGEVCRVVLLSPAPLAAPDRLLVPVVVVASTEEPAIDRIRADYARMPDPKRLVLIPGAAHAQHVFATAEGGRLTEVLVDVLTEACGAASSTR